MYNNKKFKNKNKNLNHFSFDIIEFHEWITKIKKKKNQTHYFVKLCH